MKPVATTLIALAIASFATAASAHVVEITTSIPVAQASDKAELKAALESAIEDAVKQTIRFTPTVVTLHEVRRVGDRIYLMLLVVDREGEELMKQLAIDTGPERGDDETTDDDSVKNL